MSNDITRKFNALSDRERTIIEERMGLKDNKPKSRREICKMFAISEERLIRLEEKVKNIPNL